MIFTIGWVNIKSALIYGLVTGVVAVGLYTIGQGDVFSLQIKPIANVFTFAFLGVFVSLLKNLLTTKGGNFAGVVKVIPEVK